MKGFRVKKEDYPNGFKAELEEEKHNKNSDKEQEGSYKDQSCCSVYDDVNNSN